MKKTGEGGTSSTERIGGESDAVVILVPVGLYVCSPVPARAFALTKRSRQSRVLAALVPPPPLLPALTVKFNFPKFWSFLLLQGQVQTS